MGVLSALLVVEVNNFTEREKEKCFYCEGSGYLACGMCGGRGEVAGRWLDGGWAAAGRWLGGGWAERPAVRPRA